jgi:hypothetical protein
VVVTLVPYTIAEDGELKIEVVSKPDDCTETSKKGQMLTMHYKGTFEDGKQFDSRYGRVLGFSYLRSKMSKFYINAIGTKSTIFSMGF